MSFKQKHQTLRLLVNAEYQALYTAYTAIIIVCCCRPSSCTSTIMVAVNWTPEAGSIDDEDTKGGMGRVGKGAEIHHDPLKAEMYIVVTIFLRERAADGIFDPPEEGGRQAVAGR